MSPKTKDFLERLAFALAFTAIGIAIPYLTGLNEAWAVPIVAGLQIVKNLLAQQVGDPNSAGFTDLAKDEAAPAVVAADAAAYADEDVSDDASPVTEVGDH